MSEVPGARRRDATDGEVTYFDRPVLKEHVWIWSVPAYFHVGGVAGAAALLAAVAQTDDELAGLVDRCRWIAAIGTTVGTGLLIADLGRPERFLNMLRVLRPTSPMSVGSWVLAATAGLGTAGVVASAVERRTTRRGLRRALRRGARGTTYAAGALGPPLAGYTAVLVTNTAVPAWQAARRTMPPLFMASAVVGLASALDLMDLDEREARVTRRFGIAGAVAELVLGEAVERDASRVERAGEPYEDGVPGALWMLAKAAIVLSLALRLVPGGRRWRRRLAGLLGTVGSVSLRFAVFHVGARSARDPRATFASQRAGLGGAEVTGRAGVVGSRGRRATDPSPSRGAGGGA